MIGLSAVLWHGLACAREPGQAASYPPGASLGTPVAINPPPGFYLINQANHYDAMLTSETRGAPEGPPLSVTVESTKWMWSTPWTIFGAQEMMFVTLPVVNTCLGNTPAGSPCKTALANIGFEPVNLSWKLADGLYMSAMLGFYPPAMGYHAHNAIHAGNPFWTIQPEWAISYVGHNLDLTVHLVYTVNSRNTATNYRSGDQLFVDATATRKVGRWEFGLVSYYDNQVTNDHNGGGFYPLDMPLTRPRQLALGPLLGYSRGSINFQVYFTRDVMARQGAARGNHIWTTLTLPF